jgi:hypothetical protein
MKSILMLGGVIALIGGIIFFLYKDNQRTKIELTKEKVITKTQTIVLKQKDEIIKVKTYQERLVNKPSLSASVIHRRKWLQWTKDQRNSTSSSE